ncbi:sensor histidine kinase [Nocardioides daejeonensis]|uniref:sensor histidine kinase n=1 Tax=Nocardioides daejeonensis TaxID=1046556 RepID=UPI000D74203B|nr:HAMP domain-containing sensor histidine kinase [Nocardioides daejeonensis]
MAIAAIAATVVLAIIRITGGSARMEQVATATHVCFAVSMVAGALLLLARWRFLGEDSSAWLACTLLVLAVYLRPELIVGSGVQENALRMSPVDLAVMTLLVWAMRSASAGLAPSGWRHPVLLGLVAGLALSEARFLVQERTGGHLPTWLTMLLIGCFLLASWFCIRSVLGMEGMPVVYRWHLAVPLSLAIGYHHFVASGGSPAPFPHLTCALVSTLAAFEVMATSLALVQDAHQVQLGQLAELAERAQRAEHTVEHDQELLHEARATVAGISSASQLLATSANRIPQPERAELQAMLEAEMRRLQHLLDATHEEPTERWLDLDDVVHPLVVSQQAQGSAIEHRRSGLRVWGDHDIVTAAVHVLLCNAQRHAPGARITIWTRLAGTTVVLHVADDGPGVAPDLSERLFTRGARSADSAGQGLGLYAARKSLQAHGADLLVMPSAQGALFALALPQVARCSA